MMPFCHLEISYFAHDEYKNRFIQKTDAKSTYSLHINHSQSQSTTMKTISHFPDFTEFGFVEQVNPSHLSVLLQTDGFKGRL